MGQHRSLAEYDRLSPMIRKKKILLVFICLAMAASGAAGGVYWRVHGREEGPVKVVRNYDALRDRVEALATTSGAMTVQSLGEVRYEGSAWPILMISRAVAQSSKMSVLLTGGIHGNEPAGTEFLLQFAEMLAKDDTFYSDIAFDIVPVVNPWGWVHGRRKNGAGRDLNREFTTFKAPEAILMRDLCGRKQYDLMVDFHEDSHVAGFYFYRLANPDEALCRHMIADVRDAGLPVHDGRVMTLFNAREGIITSPLWTLRFARGIRQLSMSNYFRLEGCPQAFLFETPRRLKMAKRISMYRAVLEALLEETAGRL